MLGACCSSFPVSMPGLRIPGLRASPCRHRMCPRAAGAVQAGDVGSGSALPLLAAASAGTAPALPCPAQSSRAPKGSCPRSTSCLLLCPASHLTPTPTGHCFCREMLSSPFLLMASADAERWPGWLSIPGLESQSAPGAESGELVLGNKILHTGQQQKGGLSQGWLGQLHWGQGLQERGSFSKAPGPWFSLETFPVTGSTS